MIAIPISFSIGELRFANDFEIDEAAIERARSLVFCIQPVS